MLDCPACRGSNEDRAQLCVHCGAAISGHPGAATNVLPGDGPRTVNAPAQNLGQTLVLNTPSAGAPAGPLDRGPQTLAGPWQVARGNEAPVASSAVLETLEGPRTLPGLSQPQARTMMGFGPTAPPFAAQPGDPSGSAPKTVRGLGLGVPPSAVGSAEAPPSAVGSAAAAPAGPAMLRGTLLGVSPFATGSSPHLPHTGNAQEVLAPPDRGPETVASGEVPEGSSKAQTGNERNPPVGQAPASSMLHHQTMLGVAPPLPAPSGVTPERATSVHRPDATGSAGLSPQHKGTLLGVAMPGIAPLHPGQLKPSPAAAAPPADRPSVTSPVAHGQWSPAPQLQELRSSAPPPAVPTSSQRQRLAWILGIAATVLLAILAVAILVWWNKVHLTAQVRTNDLSEEVLVFQCSNCDSGSTISLQGHTATFANHEAQLRLTRKLAIGNNPLEFAVKRANRTRSEQVSITVPVTFRVVSDLSGLTQDPPQVIANIEALPHTSVQVEGQTLVVGPSGTSTVRVDVGRHLLGPSANSAVFEHRLNYVVTQRDGAVSPGSLITRMNITPLDVAAPGLDYVTQNPTFTLSGRTGTGATLRGNGHVLQVDANGAFHQEMALSATGATRLRLRAQQPGLAPRIVEISLERVDSLRRRAEELWRTVPHDHAAVVRAVSEKPGSSVAIEGEVIAVEASAQGTRLAVSAPCDNAPCLVSIRHGAAVHFVRGDKILAYGRGGLTKRAAGELQDLSIDASFVIQAFAH